MRTTSVVVVVATSRPSRLARSWESAFSPTDELTNISFADTFSIAARAWPLSRGAADRGDVNLPHADGTRPERILVTGVVESGEDARARAG